MNAFAHKNVQSLPTEFKLYPPSLSKHAKRQKNDGQTLMCLDKPMLARDVRYQKKVCHREPACTSP